MRSLLFAVILATCAVACEQASPSTENAEIHITKTEVVDPATIPPPPAPLARKPLPTDPPIGEPIVVDDAPPTDDLTPTSDAPTTGKKQGYELISAGEEPRFELRYQAKEGTKQKATLSTKMSMNVPPQDPILFPETLVDAVVTATKVSANGKMTLEIAITGVDVKDVAGSKIPADQVKAQMGDIAGMKTTILVDALGHMTDLKGETIQQIEQTQMGFNQLAARLPVEAVGKGAKWKIRQKVDQAGLALDQVITFEVIEVTATTARLKSTGRLSAPRQTIDWQGQEVDLEKTTGTAIADMTIDFTRLVPVVRGTVEMKMVMSANGEQATMTTKSTMKMRAK